MMVSGTALTYAKALAEVASAAGEQDKARSDLGEFDALIAEGTELREALLSPAVPFQPKRRVVEEIGRRAGFSELTVNLLLTLLRNARLDRFDEVAEGYAREIDRRAGIRRAQVYSVRELDGEVRGRLESEVPQILGSRMNFNYHIDESLIGGLKIQVGSKVLDGTVRSQLEAIERRLAGR